MHPTWKCLATLVLASGLLIAPPSAHGADVTDVVDSFSRDEAFGGGYTSVTWNADFRAGPILREFLCLAHDTAAGGGASLCPGGSRVLDARELWLDRSAMSLNIDGVIGFWRHASLKLRVPVVISDQTVLKYDDGVNGTNSSVNPDNQPSLFDVRNNGPVRAGLGDPSLWLRFNPVSWVRDSTRPTWSLDLGITIPTPMVKKEANSFVGEGLLKLDMATAISTRPTRWLEPYFRAGVTFRTPVGSENLFEDQGQTQSLVAPGHIIEGRAGIEFIPWESREMNRQFAIDLGGRISYTFEGREYTDLFEALASSDCDPGNPENPCDLTTYHRDSNMPTTQRGKSDGITDVDGYATVGGWLNIRYRPIRNFQLKFGARGNFETPHYLTFADPGVDLDGKNAVELDNSDGSNEYNPVYATGIDQPGSRFRSGGITSLGFSVSADWRF